ncbi:hypothetical protein X793_07035 [Dehalococcoides mccartyi CG4]|nr:hypothetical protein X793_07035 [Dehalococcoides mccartyi CG4]
MGSGGFRAEKIAKISLPEKIYGRKKRCRIS